MHKYVVKTYYYGSECVYAFLVTEAELEAFVTRILASPAKYDEPNIQIVNDVSLFETGRELSNG
jgi:hypothetical protein